MEERKNNKQQLFKKAMAKNKQLAQSELLPESVCKTLNPTVGTLLQ